MSIAAAPVTTTVAATPATKAAPATTPAPATITAPIRKTRFSSPLDARVKLDRNHYSFDTQPYPNHPSTSNNNNIASTALQSLQSLQSSPESVSVGSPQPSSPNFNPLIIPYQPSRNSSLASFGVVLDDLDDIFLPIHSSNKFRRTSKDKVVFVGAERGGFGANCNNTKIYRSKPCIDDDDSNVDDHTDGTSTSHNGSIIDLISPIFSITDLIPHNTHEVFDSIL
jgi:hypothetical protein